MSDERKTSLLTTSRSPNFPIYRRCDVERTMNLLAGVLGVAAWLAAAIKSEQAK
jgi:hypothetical protein